MAGKVFKIEEISGTGSIGTQIPSSDLEVFEWIADSSSATSGVKAIPRKLWTFGLLVHKKKTYYPGARLPSTQVVTVAQKDQTFEGKWDDRWNTIGYATNEMRRFEAMVGRCNKVRISFEDQSFLGLIDDCEFKYAGTWAIEYKFKFSPDNREDDAALAKETISQITGNLGQDTSPETAPAPSNSLDAVDLSVQAALEIHQRLPRTSLLGTFADDIDKGFGKLASARDAIAGTLQNPQVQAGSRLIDQWKRISTQFRSVKDQASSLILQLDDARSDVTIGAQSIKSVLDFEDWKRTIGRYWRTIRGQAEIAARQSEERIKPKTLRIYQARSGDSLYSVAIQFYGTPNAWRFIADRNGLKSVKLLGGEQLIIPERGS